MQRAYPAPFRSRKWHQEIAKLLLNAQGKIDAINRHRALLPCISQPYMGHTKVVELLINAKSNIDSIASEGYTPLHLAIKMAIEVAECLIDATSRRQLIQPRGITPLHVAALQGHAKSLAS